MAHDLFLTMYAFHIKKFRSSSNDVVSNNDFLSDAYPDKEKKFENGFVQDIINLMDSKVFKNKENTHGAILEDKSIKSSDRVLDIMINGGLTGIKQYLINPDGKKEILSDKEVIGLKFFARIWYPAGSSTGFIFLQSYKSLTVKPLFDSIIKEILEIYHYRLILGRIRPTTTLFRQKRFLERSALLHVTIISPQSRHNTSGADAKSVAIQMKNIDMKGASISTNAIENALKNHNITIGKTNYTIKATYVQESTVDEPRQERTINLDNTTDTINIIPSIIIPSSHVDSDNYPIFKNMQNFIDQEMLQIKQENKL